ncbi:hypothetical protein B0H13DRAFT_1867183 [Mycena leptocephala]|nr:hypothetical protein B0H13DRAFT_1867183 [Mycena leptocephala]
MRCELELLRPDWDDNSPKGLEFAVRFDMQLQLLWDLLWAHGLPCDLPAKNIMVKLLDIATERKVTRWMAVFLICSQTVSEKPDVHTVLHSGLCRAAGFTVYITAEPESNENSDFSWRAVSIWQFHIRRLQVGHKQGAGVSRQGVVCSIGDASVGWGDIGVCNREGQSSRRLGMLVVVYSMLLGASLKCWSGTAQKMVAVAGDTHRVGGARQAEVLSRGVLRESCSWCGRWRRMGRTAVWDEEQEQARQVLHMREVMRAVPWDTSRLGKESEAW